MNKKKSIYTICSAICISLAMLLNYSVQESISGGKVAQTGLGKIVYEFLASIECDGMVQMVVFVAAAVAIYKSYEQVKANKTVLIQFVSFLLAVMIAVGKSMSATNSLVLFYEDSVQVIKTMIIIAGYYVFYLHCAILLYCFIHKETDKRQLIGQKFFKDKFYLKPFLVISAVWIPQILLRYPGAVCWDTMSQLYQYFGFERFTAHHPPFDTWLMGLFLDFGKHIGSMNIGFFLYIFIQTLCFIAVLAYTFPLLEKLKVKPLYRLLLLGIYCVVPYYVGYAGVMLKDSIYSIAFLWYFLCLVHLLYDASAFCGSYKNVARMVASATLVVLSRKNGIYVVVPMAFALIIYFAKIYWNEKKKVLRIVSILVVPVILNFAVEGSLNARYHIAPGSKGEMLSIPFQQTARYVKEYGDEVTEEEKEAINAVLAYDEIAERYDPIISDPVKATFKGSATPTQVMEYFKVWGRQLIKHPLVYIEATLNSNYGIVCPNIDNYVYYIDADACIEWFPEIKLSVPSKLEKVQEGLVGLYKCIHEIPVVSLFSNVGFYVVVFLYLLVFLLKDKRYVELLLSIPGLLSIAITVASPVFLGHPRYLFPVVYTVPLFFALYTAKDSRPKADTNLT